MMRDVKRLFDPLGLLNPGKKLPDPRIEGCWGFWRMRWPKSFADRISRQASLHWPSLRSLSWLFLIVRSWLFNGYLS
jgi:hypothetical protein